ncbi:MAG: AAA family ATPase [Lachnospiraceae bacterium]|nr:AAA family ATPase [Lachnospiraceae bacterium]
MNIKRAKQEIKDTIAAYLLKDEYGEYVIPQIRQRPVLLLGAPGIGKTQIMEQIAKECGIGLVSYTITHHTRQSAIGLPFVSKQSFGGREYTVTEYTMSEIVAAVYEKMEKTGLSEGILFIDEINCVSETLAPAMLQFLQCKTFGSHEIPQGWIIVAAGNPPEYNKSVREFDVVTMDRVKKIEVEPDFAVWKEYALLTQLHPAVIAYLNARTGNFYKMETTVDGRKFATPRGWEDLSQMLIVYEKLGLKMDREVIIQYVQHEKVAKDFANYLELYEKYQMDYQLDAVLAGTIDPILLKKAANASFDERLSVVSLILSRCRMEFANVIRQEQLVIMLYDQLKIVKEGLLGAHGGQAAVFVKEIAQSFQAETQNKKTAELLTREEKRLRRKAGDLLEAYAQKLAKAGTQSAEQAMTLIKEWFDARQDELERQQGDAGQMLEHAFDFLEAAFGAGQEMVIFITELNNDYYSVRFLQNCECERYYRYNKELLFEESSRAIEARLRAMGR